MIAAGRAFPEIAQQLLAAKDSLVSLLVRLVEIELRDCLPTPEARDEVDDLLRTALGRNAPLRRAARLRQHPMTAPSHPQLEGRTSP